MSQGNSSQEVDAGGVDSDEDVEQTENIWLRADSTPPAVTKSCSNKWPVYGGTFFTAFQHYFLYKSSCYSYCCLFHYVIGYKDVNPFTADGE